MSLLYKNDIPFAAERQPSSYPEKDSVHVEGGDVSVSSNSVDTPDTNITHVEEGSFEPGTRLHIHARGHGLVRVPLPSSELEITIADSNGNPIYISTRAKRCSGSAVLSHVKLGDIISTAYFFGLSRDPVIKLLQPVNASLDTVKVNSRWKTRATSFSLPNGKSFEWFYDNVRSPVDRKSEHINVLVLRQVYADSGKLRRSKRPKAKQSPS